MIAPASATYQQAVPMPLIAPLRIRYCMNPSVLSYLMACIIAHPFVSIFAVAIVCRALYGEGHRTDNKSPFDAYFVHERAA